MSEPYQVVVKRNDGSFAVSVKEKESSAIKSAKMYVTMRKEPAAVVLLNGKVVFDIPEGTRSDQAFMKKALAKAKSQSPPTPPPSTPPKKSKKQAKPAKEDFSDIPEELRGGLHELAAEYDAEMKKGNIIIPETKPKIKACDIENLEAACIAFSVSRCTPLDQAHKICETNRDLINDLAGQVSQKKITKDEAVMQLVSSMQGNCPMTAQKPVETKPTGPTLDVSKILRKHRGVELKPTRIREDLGVSDFSLEEAEEPTTLPDGIVIYTTEESDQGVHEMLAYAMGYTPNSLINLHNPAGIPGYAYRRSLPLSRPTIKKPSWRAMGERIAEPATLVKRIKEKYSDVQARIEIAPGVELE